MGDTIHGRLMADLGATLGKIEHAKLGFYAGRAQKSQKKVLKDLMRVNKNTVYGKANNFRDVHSVEDYQRLVPLSTYADYGEYIDRMANKGEKNLITHYHISRFAESSGSVGKPKYIPLSARTLWVCQCFSFSAPVGCAVKYFKSKGMRLPQQKGLMTLEITSHKLPCHKTVSCLSGIPLMNLKPIVRFFVTSPEEIMFPKDTSHMNMHYLKLRFALPDRDVSYLSTIIITVLESMMQYLEANWEMLCDDIEKGTINESIEVPDDIRKSLLKKIKPDPKRAEELRIEFRKGFDTPIVPRIWPKVGFLFGMGAGSLSVYAKKLKKYTGDIPVHNIGYGASEALMAIPLELNSTDYVMLPQNGFYEFLPVGSAEGTKPLTIGELEVGKDYEVILTNLSGLYRYRIEDVVKCTGYYKQSPTVNFMYRLKQVLNIAGEKTSQQMLDWSVNQMADKYNISLVGHSVYADIDSHPGHYVLFVEADNEVPSDKLEEMAAYFDKKLSDSNLFISDATNTGTLGKTELRVLKKGTYDRYSDILKRDGANLNQVKPICVINTEEKKNFFFSNCM
jgi:hypothetical protein